MEKTNLLKKYLDQASYNLLCYSRNYSMSEPKEGYEQQWQETQEEIVLLEDMIQEVDKEKTAEFSLRMRIPRFISKDLVIKIIDGFDKALQHAFGASDEEWAKQGELIEQYLAKADKPFSEFTYEDLEDFHAAIGNTSQLVEQMP